MSILTICGYIVTKGLEEWQPKEYSDPSNFPKDFRLKYLFHKSEYIGAAHGAFGVMYLLMKALASTSAYVQDSHDNIFIKILEMFLLIFLPYIYKLTIFCKIKIRIPQFQYFI